MTFVEGVFLFKVLFVVFSFCSEKLWLVVQQSSYLFRGYWAIPERIQTGGLRTWNFQGYQRNSMWNFQGLTKNELEFPRVTKKIMWNFQGSLFLALEFPRDLTQFCGLSRVELCFAQNFRGYSKKMKNSKGVFKKIFPQPPLFGFFLEQPIMNSPL